MEEWREKERGKESMDGGVEEEKGEWRNSGRGRKRLVEE